eukprot:CAMPEP_0176493936 /NCGR_PEP_ID=MMETSP0200_2-20121128/9813_1 /TAXON_ID=947934 /ORGANISM="Chaetoceros sp., Strain GSL56" /LENGTH=318 /DNA_ID=CAMNT_0017891629 /DNA_START=155 /DNA_END=1111 /DNA_ORIENTATION=-
MPTLQPQSTPKRPSPWRRALQKLTPPRKSTERIESTSDDATEKKTKKSIFSTPVKKFKTRTRAKGRKNRLSNKEPSFNDEDQVVTVHVLPKSPLRDPNQGGTISEIEVCTPGRRPLSPPRILKASIRTLETENTFDEMFQLYMKKFHNHGGVKGGCFAKCKFVNQKETQQSYLRKTADLSSTESTSETSCSMNDVRIVSMISKEVSDLTLPRPIREPMSTLEVLSRFTLCMSEVANAFACPCVAMAPPTRRRRRSGNRLHGPFNEIQESDFDDSDLEYELSDNEEEDGDDDGASTSTYNSAASSCDDEVEKGKGKGKK